MILYQNPRFSGDFVILTSTDYPGDLFGVACYNRADETKDVLVSQASLTDLISESIENPLSINDSLPLDLEDRAESIETLSHIRAVLSAAVARIDAVFSAANQSAT